MSSSTTGLKWFKSSYSGGGGGNCVEVAFTQLDWSKSSYSGGGGDNCVEVAFTEPGWSKSSYSGSGGGNCVEVAIRTTAVHIRDSKTPQGGRLTVTPAAWAAFLAHL
ncbi:DUF397 domain-containing protein [Streptomyces luomodiensis]|uniref:DUF397 domain-containing protein n=1 Tax=Streptomyces luomodiensis TaxID=3026192 RepID=A0ABY9UZD7_9ACTN|nr:DUF397 domain-containing protein [Streptomyces sp. SCA4-21]WNE96813.1 DUF397 domain-containing protein [Streptomyces sp. SCA4-21]